MRYDGPLHKNFSYKDPIDPERYKEFLKRGLTNFVQFTRARPTTQKMEQDYLQWWILRGPANFRSNDDALRYKHELWAFIEELADGEPINNSSES